MRATELSLGGRRKLKPAVRTTVSGTSHFPLLFVAAFFFVVGGMYVFAVNERAVYGYDIRSLEQELATLKKENAALRLREAEGRSLTRVEAGSQNLRMERAEPVIQLTVERESPVAYR